MHMRVSPLTQFRSGFTRSEPGKLNRSWLAGA